ncbi:ATP-binding cassette domain-containing protein [Bacillus mangrovi]|uniref:ATP-binding cassette domain-containing protein n=1 Tax=Metabacillus mangrovi TaxID=1491830 RepID=A0A7X2S7N3_9BACI|nr:ABC transporter ATP-binding protein [Metabacillus mangrovi]MTH54790.1 ATP-binding cassette domain-containing protein [Metabacillus mangrovi]
MIEVKEAKKKYGRKTVLDGITFQAKKGEITCLIGINGVGKTTILKAVMGLTPIHSGSITIDGQKLDKNMLKKITYIPDAPIMQQGMTIEQYMEFMEDFYPNWNRERAFELLQFFRLSKSEKIGNLSKGNAAKASLLMGLALDTDYLLMDEPFSGIDLFSREQIARVFTSHLIEGRGVIITTHEIQDIEHLIDQVVLVDNGVVMKQFYAEEMRIEEGKSVVDVMREVYQG